MLFTPDRQVVSLRESGLKHEPMDAETVATHVDGKKQRVEMQATKTRQIRVDD
jgi:hypothetical protein